MNRFGTNRVSLFPGCSISQAGDHDIRLDRILALYFPGIQILLDTKPHILHDHRDTSLQHRGSPPSLREKNDAAISQVGRALIIQGVPASPEARSNSFETRRGVELRVVPDFYHYCLEVLDRLTKR